MANILVLITRSEGSGDRDHCKDDSELEWAEWEGCWWRNDTVVPKNHDDCSFFLATFSDELSKDRIHIFSSGRNYEPLEPNESQNAIYFLFSEKRGIKRKLRNVTKSQKDKHIWIVLRQKSEEIINYLVEIIDRGNNNLLICEHSVDTKYVRYSSTGAYWDNLMRLRYASVGGDVSKSRKESFDKVWIELDETSKENSFRTLKHDLANLFVDIKSDLEGWLDYGLRDEDGKLISKQYSEDDLEMKFKKAHKALYGSEKSILSVVGKESLEEIEPWQDIKKNVLTKDRSGMPQSWDVFEEIANGNVDRARQLIEEGNSFSKWAKRLDKKLEELRQEVFYR